MKYILGALGVIAAILLLTWFVVSRGNDVAPAVAPKVVQLIDYADKNSSVSLTTIGSVVGDDQHRAIRIIVTPNERRVEVLSGYNESVIKSESFPNNRAAYGTFLSALQRQGFLADKRTSITDERGVCATGQRFEFTLKENSSEVSKLWTTSCGDVGTFAGKGSAIRTLFEKQIPDYASHVRGVRL